MKILHHQWEHEIKRYYSALSGLLVSITLWKRTDDRRYKKKSVAAPRMGPQKHGRHRKEFCVFWASVAKKGVWATDRLEVVISLPPVGIINHPLASSLEGTEFTEVFSLVS